MIITMMMMILLATSQAASIGSVEAIAVNPSKVIGLEQSTEGLSTMPTPSPMVTKKVMPTPEIERVREKEREREHERLNMRDQEERNYPELIKRLNKMYLYALKGTLTSDMEAFDMAIIKITLCKYVCIH